MNQFQTEEDLPKLTSHGFEVVKCPQPVWNIIQELYKILIKIGIKEKFEGMEEFIPGDQKPDLFNLSQAPEILKIIHKELQPIHEQWCNQALIPTFIYGIRSYNTGSTLTQHVDRIRTHHISSIIIVDKLLNKKPDWPLDIQAHDGTWHKIYANTGDMILYESAVCKHGRDEVFQGEWYRNFYVHYRLADWKWIETQE